MRAENISYDELLSFKPDEGKIFLQDRRAIFMGADAMGTLRKDLIAALGMDRAKGFLLRYGWNCGFNDAMYVNKMFSWAEDIEWVLAGPKTHTITGNALVIPKEIRVNRETGEFYAEGFWYNSYEAEQHIDHFGYHNEPVCSTLVGYAGGYCSQYLGSKVIFREMECVGKGDPHCRYVGKPIEDWDTEINSDLAFYEEENLAIELDRAYRRIEKQKEELKDILNINEKLSNVLIQGGGLSTIVKVLGQNLRTSVVLEDKNFNLLESFGDYQSSDLLNFIQSPTVKQASRIQRLMVEKRTVHLSVSEQFGWQHERLISPILLKNEVCGYLSLIKNKSSFNEKELIALERTSSICAAQFLNERTSIEAEYRIRGEFLNDILSDHLNVKDLTYRNKLMGYDLDKPHYVFLFNNHHSPSSLNQYDSIDVGKRLVEIINHKLKIYGRNCLVSNRLDCVVALIPHEIIQQTKLDAKPFGELLVNMINSEDAAFRLILGISSLCNGIAAFGKGYKEALKSIGMAESRRMKSTVVSFDELGFLGVLLHAKDAQALEDFAMKQLKELVDYDLENQGEFLKTLYIFLRNQGNIHQTSREMMISVGGLRYRLKRIQEISDIDLSGEKDLFETQLALKILMFYGIFEV